MGKDTFGKPGAPRLEIFKEKTGGPAVIYKKCGGTFRTVGEGDRSANVAPDFCGLVICDYEKGSIWDRLIPEKASSQKKELRNKILRRINGRLLTDGFPEGIDELLKKETFFVEIWIAGCEEKYTIK